MRIISDFEYFIEEGIVKKQAQDKSRAAFLASESEKSHAFLLEIMRNLGFKEVEIQFANQMRYFRNGITYYGKQLDIEYAKSVFEFMNRVYSKLKEKAKS